MVHLVGQMYNGGTLSLPLEASDSEEEKKQDEGATALSAENLEAHMLFSADDLNFDYAGSDQ